MKKLKRHEPHDLHPCVYVCIADDVAELEAALAEAVALLKSVFYALPNFYGSDEQRERVNAFIEKHKP